MRGLVVGLLGLGVVLTTSSRAPGDPPPPGWLASLTTYDHVEGYQVDPSAYAPWAVDGLGPTALPELLAALRELDGAYGGWILDTIPKEALKAPRWLREHLEAAVGPRPPCQPTLAMVVVAPTRTLALLIDEVEATAAVLDSAGEAPSIVHLRGAPDDRTRALSDVAPYWPSHAATQRAARRLSPDDRAVLERPDELAIYALHDVDWEGAWERTPATAGDAVARGLAALAAPGVTAGRVNVTRPGARVRFAAQLVSLVSEAPGVGVMCWMPHHALHARRGEREILAILCLDCSKALVYTTGMRESPRTFSCGGSHLLFHDMNSVFRLHGIVPPLTVSERARQRREAEAEPASPSGPR